jgi:oxygen-dependent protoporphyrinogen oxidase
MPQYLVGHLRKVEEIEQRVHREQGLFLTGCAYKGIGISDIVHDAEITAEKVIQFLKKVDNRK